MAALVFPRLFVLRFRLGLSDRSRGACSHSQLLPYRCPGTRLARTDELLPRCKDFHVHFAKVNHFPVVASSALEQDASECVICSIQRWEIDLPQVLLHIEKCHSVDLAIGPRLEMPDHADLRFILELRVD